MLNTYTRGYNASKTFLSVALFLLIISNANSLLSSNYQNIKHLSQGNLTGAPSDSGVVYNGTFGDGNERQGRLFFGTKSRTLFGARRRIQFALLPIMYKLGVISTMLVGLTVMVLKGLTIGVILLFFALESALTYSVADVFSESDKVSPDYSYYRLIAEHLRKPKIISRNETPVNSKGNVFLKHKHHQSSQPVHFHLHPGDFHSKHPIYHGYEPSGPWDKTSDEDAPGYENYNPSYNAKLNILRHPYRYSHRDYFPYQGR